MSTWILWEFVVDAWETGVIVYALRRQLGVRVHHSRRVYVGAIILLAAVITLNYLSGLLAGVLVESSSLFVSRITLFLIDEVYALTAFGSSISRRLLFGSFPLVASVVADAVTQLFAGSFSEADLESATRLGIDRFPFTIIYLLAATIFMLVVAYLPRRETNSFRLPVWILVVLAGMLVAGMFATDQLAEITFAVSDSANASVGGTFAFVYLVFFGVLITAVILVLYIGDLSARMQRQSLDEQRARLESQHSANIAEVYESLRQIKHDLKHDDTVALDLLHRKKYDELTAFLNQRSAGFYDATEDTVVSEAALNAMLVTKMRNARKDHVCVELTALLPDAVVSASKNDPVWWDFCDIVGNLLDNAIEATTRLTNPEEHPIAVHIDAADAMLRVTVENTFDGVLHISGQTYRSSKTGPGHGLGLASVRRLVKKHEGQMVIEPTGSTFFASISMPFSSQEQM